MLTITRLYTEPEIIAPIDFTTGLNIILGEKDDSSDKRNGVGKSLCIEFINFALLKRRVNSRVSLIPKEVFPHDTFVCLNFRINNRRYTIKRSLLASETPLIIEDGYETVFAKVEDAVAFLTERLFSNAEDSYPSFRAMLGPLIRDERSEFKSLVNCYDTKLRIPEDYAPHLYLLGIDIEVYELIKQHIKTIDDINKDISRIKENVLLIRQKNIDDARSDLNELDDEVHSIEASIDRLENLAGYDIIKDEIISLEEQIESKRRRKGILKVQLSKLKLVSQKVDITPSEISEFYEELRKGLGDLISKSLEEAMSFKAKIDEFQNRLISERRASLSSEISEIDKELTSLDKQYAQHLKVLDQSGDLKNLKQTYAAYKEKADQLSQLRSFIDRYDELEIQKQKAKTKKETELLRLQSLIQIQKKIIDNFQKTILEIHDFIQGNKQASFQLRQTTSKQIIELLMRIDSDGSHSVERAKVFIYDIALLTNSYTQNRHPGFLIHDNIFDVDQDTLTKSIQFLEEKAEFRETQYILTINSDRLELDDQNEYSGLTPYIRAIYTKQNRFLKQKYQETQSS
ncbi:DUF2326 domain-containing protein [Chitinophaga sp. 22536]|uniref:DUF2326 domain-containing protein n=1 Tax=unclassified Chitinophaga TaxID=2619133 RepID=UPI003F82EF4F